MKVYIRTHEGIKQTFHINPNNLPKLLSKYGDRLEIPIEPKKDNIG